MNICERCKFPVQWRMAVRPVGGGWIKVCEDCAEDVQRERDEDNREPSAREWEPAAGDDREQQAAIQRDLK